MPKYPADVKKPILQYVCLGVLLVIAVAYQVRFTEANFPGWFHRPQSFELPFRVLSDPKEPFKVDFLTDAATDAGIHRGDGLVAVNGRPVTGTAVYGEAMAKARVGDRLEITYRTGASGHAAEERTVAVVLKPASRSDPLGVMLLVALPTFCIALGFWVAFVRPRDPLAWLLLALLLSFSASPTAGVESWGPGVRDAAMIYHTAFGTSFAIWVMLFGIYFPEPFPAGWRWRWWEVVKWAFGIPLAIAVLLSVIRSVGTLENYARVAALDRLVAPLQKPVEFVGLLAVASFFACIGTKYRLAVSRDVKRRLRLLYFGAIACFTPLLILMVVVAVRQARTTGYFPWQAFLVCYSLLCLFPVLLAYLIIVDRAMDVRVVIRQGLQYALATGSIRALQLLIGSATGIFVFYFVHGRTLHHPVAYYCVVALWIIFVLRMRQVFRKLKAWTDRRFFREAYNTEQILSDLGDKVRSIVETKPLLATVAERIAESLHVGRVAVLIDGRSAYRPAYAVGYNSTPNVAFPETAGLIQQLQRENEPAKVYLDDPSSWVYRTPGITDDERSQLATLDAELLLPLSVKDKLLGFISLGEKRSEEPYSGADLRLLKSVAAQTGMALENARLTSAVAEEAAQRERLHREVEIAREVQERLFPQKLPPIPGLDYSGKCRPALGVGGDYYDFLALPGGNLGVALGDVSGKGIAAALMMASLQASLRAEAIRGAADLASLIQNVNRLVYDATSENRYATFFFARYDPELRRLGYVNAGHNPPMLFRKRDGALHVTRLEAGGTVIGLFSNFCYRESSIDLEPGDLVVAYTDGITETMNPREDEWGEEALMESVEACDGLPSDAVISRVITRADEFAAGAPQHDDMTMVVLRLNP